MIISRLLSLISFVIFHSVIFGQNEKQDCISYIDSVSREIIYTYVDSPPKPVGGEAVLFEELGKGVKVKPISKEDVHGLNIVLVSFTIDSKGEIVNEKILIDDLSYLEIPKQMFEVIRSFIWLPGSCNGEFVSVEYQLPFRFCLQ